MAPLLSRLFSNKKRTKNNFSHKLLEETQNSQHQARALLFRECDWRGRKLLFDSKTVRKKDISSKNNGCVSSKEGRKTDQLPNQSSSNCKPPAAPIKVRAAKTSVGSSKNATVYEYLKPSPDVKMLGEMLFGSVAMSFWGSTTKIHTIRSPPQLMISVVFPTPIVSNQRLRDFDNSGSLQNSISECLIPKCEENEEFSSMAHSVPVDVPGRFSVSSRELSFNTSDSFNSTLSSSGTTSLFFSPDSAGSSFNSSYSSFQRRWLRNFNTNIECGRSRRSDEMSSVDESKINGQRRVKLGLAIVFSLGESLRDENSFRNFFFSHIALIEGRISKFCQEICNAYLNKDNFVHIVYEGLLAFRSSIRDLYSTPRLANPMWLTVTSPSNHHPQLKKFFTEFLSLIRQFDTKQTHFFVSTLLTAVLTHHLGWVSTVQPNENIPVENFQMKESASWLDQLAKSHPYNPLWIQLGDLYGATGFPSKVSQTVVLGKSAETILKFLRVLSYFIRCSDVYERIQDGDVMQESPRHTKLFNASSQSDSVGVITKRDGIKCFQVEDVLEKTTRVNCTCLHLKASLPSIEDILPNEGSVIFLADLNIPSNVDLTNTKRSNELRNLEMSESDNCASGGTDSLGYGSLGNIIDTSNVKENLSLSFQESCLWCTNHDRINELELGLNIVNIANKVGLEAVPETKGESFNEPLSICLTPTATNIPGVVPAISYVKIDTELSNEINVSSPEELSRTKLYIREYCTLRFRSSGDPVVESALTSCTREEVMASTPNKGEDNEAPEEGYQSMDDTYATNGRGLGQLVETLFTQLPPATKEYPLPRLQSIDVDKVSELQTGFGWSLMASLTDHYLTDFCLQGVLGNVSDETIYKELCSTVKASVLGEPTSAAICLIADTDTWSVKICSSSGLLFGNRKVSACMSPLVAEILDALCQMSQLNMSTEFCLMHLENCLQELLFRSRSLAAILTEEADSSLEKAVSLLAIDTNDLPLLISIATTHSPQLSSFNRC